jgi:hypothetical protein
LPSEPGGVKDRTHAGAAGDPHRGYVAAARARDSLLISGAAAAFEFLFDLLV